MQTALTAMQFIISLPVSRLADSPQCGRKPVLLVGLSVLAASTLYFGFVTTFAQALVLRIIEGAMNGNSAVIRAMISEVVAEPKHHSRAFLLMPLCFNVGALVGPPIAGFLVTYAQQYAGEDNFLGTWPYAPPMLLMGSIILLAFLSVFFLLEEVGSSMSRPSGARSPLPFLWSSC